MKTVDVLQVLSAGLTILPYCFSQDKFAAWQTATQQKLSKLSEATAKHAGAAWLAGIGVVAASARVIEHDFPTLFRTATLAARQDPHATLSVLSKILLVLIVLGGIFLVYVAALLLMHLVCRIIARHEKGVVSGFSAVLLVIISLLKAF